MNVKGYTLLEVTLFLALSSAMALVAFIGLGPRLNNARFSDSVRSLESSIHKNLSDSEKGTSFNGSSYVCSIVAGKVKVESSVAGSDTSGTSSDCVVNGRVAYFESNKVTFKDIVSFREPTGSGCNHKEDSNLLEDVIRCYEPYIVNNGASIYSYKNNLAIQGSPNIKSFAVMRSPRDNHAYIFQVRNKIYPWVIERDLSNMGPNGALEITQRDSSEVCFKSSNRTVKLTFSSRRIDPIVDIGGVCT